MNDVKIKLNSPAIRNLLKSAEMEAACMSQIRRVQAACGPGYEVDAHTGKTRVNAMIKAATPAAKRDNAKHGTLAKALKGLSK